MSSNSDAGAAGEPRTERLTIRGIDYAVREWGDRASPPLLLLHGWGDCAASWQFTVDAFQRDWRVLAPDWRGFGESGHNAAAYWFPDYLADLDALLDAFDLREPVPLVGHSMGGNVAALYAGVCPERVAALINVEGFGLADSDPQEAPERYRRWLDAGRRRREHPGYASLDKLVAKILERSPGIARDRARYVARRWARRGSDGRWRPKADAAHHWPNAVLYRRAEARACWQRIRAPVLLVSGSETGFEAQAALWRDGDSGYPDARAVTVDGAGHMLHLERPEALAAAIEEFLGARL